MFRFGVLSCCLLALALGQQQFGQQQQHLQQQQQHQQQQQQQQQDSQLTQKHGFGFGNGQGHHGNQFPNVGHVSPPFFPPLPSDRYYCSAQASFPVVETYEVPITGNSGYGGQKPTARRFSRKSCRFAATNSQESCNMCCEKATRFGNADEEIFGTLFFFDPKSPPTTPLIKDVVGAGSYGMDHPETQINEINADTGRAQCFCCTRTRH